MGGEHFDLVVIGGGPAGEKAAAQAAYFDKRVALVERSSTLGGTMVGGVVSSKTMREAALYLTSFRHRGVYDIGLDLPADAAMARLRSRTDQVVDTVAEATAANMARHGVTVVAGHGRLGAGRRVTVTDELGNELVLHADVVLLAPGSMPLRPPGVPFDDPRILDVDEAAQLTEPLRDVTVIGGGAVGCELASVFLALGARVTLVDSGPQLLPFADAEISEVLAATFRASGMTVIQGAGRAAVEVTPETVRVLPAAGEPIATEHVVFATGRAGNTAGLLEADAGVTIDDRGRIVVDERFETAAPGVYAAGDVIGPPALASVSMEQARVAMCWAFDLPLKRSVGHVAPFGVYSIPEIAMVGLTEAAAAEQQIEVATGRAQFSANTRTTIAGTTEGLLKLVVRVDDLRVVGVHIVGDAATELIHLGQQAIHFDATLEYFIHATFNVPTASEAYKYAAYDALGDIDRRRFGDRGDARVEKSR